MKMYISTAFICLAVGTFMKKVKRGQGELYVKEGFAAVALSWIVMSVFGALPFVLTGEIRTYINALFETVSGFTTTGISI